MEHAFSLPLAILQEVYQKISHTPGVDLVGMAETTGVCFPGQLRKYLEAVYQSLPEGMSLQLHMHNDHGLVAANFLEALSLLAENGRRAIFDISVAGFGERNGVLSHGDVFSILYLLNSEKLKARYRINHYASLVRLIERAIHLPLCRRDPLNPWAFSHSAGPHLDGMINGRAYQVIPPQEFGFQMKLNVGHCVTGYRGLQYWAAQKMDLDLTDKQAKKTAAALREVASRKGPLSDQELQEFIRANLG